MEINTAECPNRDRNNAACPCPKTECDNHGLCCQCIAAHKNKKDAPILKQFPFCLRDLVKEAAGGQAIQV